MSKLALGNGDDYPEAAHRHLRDSHALLARGHLDGAAYLAGYVVECALKSLIVLEGSTPPRHHRLNDLRGEVNRLAVVAGAKAARYFGSATRGVAEATISAWNPEMRYRAASMTPSGAADWYSEASQVFRETILQMQLDGEL